ncbi:spore germination protein [Brevibacillus aydinogluensis]|jgi:spore germination protein|uniref:germination protein YpeB n=1 Tax=Brevibacillus TaxID=55080 RepID=UPI001B9268B0|nr:MULTISPECIES: germination protein YpeB [Brevibacillus]MBR8658586.1 germination protein YpeB [Brevibacillus sp. NL20B1]MDT3415344.1 spore germination protein [Brevibacillus aydinogluensis]
MGYGTVARVLFPVALVALVGVGVWGYQEHNEKNSILIKAENQYQRAFHDLNYHIDNLHDELGKSLVINTRRQMTPCLTNVWRLANEARSEVGQLPLTLMPFNNTEEFLSRVADFSYRVAVRDLDKEPLTAKEYQTLKELHKHSKNIQNQLRNVQANVFAKQLRWMDVETALASDDKKSDNTIIDGFRTIEKNMSKNPEIDWGVGIRSLETKKLKRIKGIDGKPIDKEEAKRIALAFTGLNPAEATVEVDDNGKAEGYTAYSVRITSKKAGAPINLDVTKRSGKVVWMMNEREVGEERISLDEAEESARKFLRDHGFGNMVVSESDTYDRIGIFTFVPEQNGVRLNPDAVTVKTALDNGSVIAFNAAEYLFNHKPRKLPKPRVTKEQARARVNPAVNVKSQRLALIESKDDGRDVLCWEITGTYEDSTYTVYINALTGDEEDIIKMDTGAEGEAG